MNCKFKLDEQDLKKVKATMTITMPLDEWISLRGTLDQFVWPQSGLFDFINELIQSARTEFFKEGK